MKILRIFLIFYWFVISFNGYIQSAEMPPKINLRIEKNNSNNILDLYISVLNMHKGKIFYTTDGSVPTLNSMFLNYNGTPIKIKINIKKELKLVAVSENFEKSDVISVKDYFKDFFSKESNNIKKGKEVIKKVYMSSIDITLPRDKTDGTFDLMFAGELGGGSIFSLSAGCGVKMFYGGVGFSYLHYDIEEFDTSMKVYTPFIYVMKPYKNFFFRIRYGRSFINETKYGIKKKTHLVSPDIFYKIPVGNNFFAGISFPLTYGEEGSGITYNIGVGYFVNLDISSPFRKGKLNKNDLNVNILLTKTETYDSFVKLVFNVKNASSGKIYYTTDGTTPTLQSRYFLYSDKPIKILLKKSKLIKFFFVSIDGKKTPVFERNYIITTNR